MTFDIKKIRNDFPILTQSAHVKPLAYLDNAASAQKPQSVIDAITEFYTKQNANVHRAVHHLSNLATQAHENARQTIQKFINAKHSCEIIFTRGTTESINLVAYTFGEKFIKKEDEVIVSEMEHHSNFVPWQLICEKKQAKLQILPIGEDGQLSIEKLPDLINKKTKIIAIGHISNALGTINPVEKIIRIAHKKNIPVLIDSAQSAVHNQLDVQNLDCDFLVFSGHKLYGPTGIGVLYGKQKWLKTLPPWQSGGEMIETVSIKKTTFNELPFKFEAGTPNVAGAIGLEKAINYIQKIGWKNIINQEKKLGKYAQKKLSEIKGLKIYGNPEDSTIFSFNIRGIHHYDLGILLDKMGIAVRTGHLCAETIMQHYKVEGMVRISLAFYNTEEEIDRLIEGILKIKKMIK